MVLVVISVVLSAGLSLQEPLQCYYRTSWRLTGVVEARELRFIEKRRLADQFPDPPAVFSAL